MKMNYNKKNIKMQKKYSHHMLQLLVPSIAIALIIVVGIVFVPTVVVNQSAAAQSSSSQQLPQQQQQNQNTNISLATSSEAARNLAQKSGINSTQVQNASDLNQKLAPGGSLANFQEQLKGVGQQLGLNGPIIVFVPTANQSAAAQSSSSQQLPQQQNQNTNISLATSSEAARNLAQKSGINSTQVQNASDLNQKLTPSGGLAKFQEQLKGLGQQLGLNGTIVVFVPTANQSAAAQSSSSQQLPQQQQNQNINISLATSSEAAINLAQKSGINSTEVSTKPVQNASELTQKLAPGGGLA